MFRQTRATSLVKVGKRCWQCSMVQLSAPSWTLSHKTVTALSSTFSTSPKRMGTRSIAAPAQSKYRQRIVFKGNIHVMLSWYYCGRALTPQSSLNLFLFCNEEKTSRSFHMWLKNRTYLGSVWESPSHPLAWTSHTNSKDWGHRFLHREDYVHQKRNLCWCIWGRCYLWKGIMENFNKKFCTYNHI